MQERNFYAENQYELAEEYFFVLGRDRGISYITEPDSILRRVDGATVRQFACSDYENIQTLMDQGIDHRWENGNPVVFEVTSVPVVGDNVEFRGGSARIGGKYILNGASGDRIYSQYLKRNPGMHSFRRANRFFSEARGSTTLELPVADLDMRSLPVGIECRNRRNYYHFMTETLPSLSHFIHQLPKSITIHCRGADESRFSTAFIEHLYPEVADRVNFSDRRTQYNRAILALNFRHALYANGDPRILRPIELAKSDAAWESVSSHAKRRNLTLENTYDVSLRLMRERALKLLPPELSGQFPKKIWVSRDNTSSINQRPMVGEDELFAELSNQGFEKIYFEHLSPWQQIAAVQAADTVISMHGAFFTNMMFARPQTHFVELGTIQIQRHRWGDFLGNAHASGCRYTTVFVDAAEPDPSTVRPISTGMSGVRVGRKAIEAISQIVNQSRH